MRKRFTAILFLLLAAASALNAQKLNKFWSSGKLSWNDYTVSSMLAEDGAASSNSFGWETKDTEQSFGNLTVHRVTSQVYLNGAQSWVNPDFATDDQLTFNQLFFDLNELQCRKMLREMYDPSVSYEAGFLQDYYIGLTAVKMSEITIASDHGRDMETLAYYQAIVDSQLATLKRSEFNPKSLRKDKHGFGFRMGAGGEFFLGSPSEYLRNAFVMDMGVKYFYKKAFIEVQAGLGGLAVKNDFTVGLNSFNARDVLTELQIGGLAGFSFYDGPWFRIAPFAGFGYNGMGLLADEDDEDSETIFFGGARLMGGLETDIKFSRNAFLYPDERSITENGINLRVYVARAGLGGVLDGYSLNFTVSYFFQSWDLKSW